LVVRDWWFMIGHSSANSPIGKSLFINQSITCSLNHLLAQSPAHSISRSLNPPITQSSITQSPIRPMQSANR
jgi:hypothetical protein